MAKVQPIPDGYHSLTPYLVVRNAAKAIEFYQKALNAKLIYKLEMNDGKIGHAEMQIGNSRFMLADEFLEMGYRSPLELKGTSTNFMLYVDDVDKVAANATKHGMVTTKPIENRFYGDRNGGFLDPFGHEWTIATHIEDVSNEEVAKRAAKLFAGGPSGSDH